MSGAALHLIFESLAYTAGLALYGRDRSRAGDFLSDANRSSILVAAILGGAAGAYLLVWFEGKTVVGGLLGATMAVEWTKRRLGIERRTGDLFAIPLALGIAIGRVGCFLYGLPDHTYGIPTSLPWGMDFADGVRRHPVQLYEVGFLLVLAAVLHRMRSGHRSEGLLFRLFLTAYLGFRLAVDFLKPERTFGGLSAIQWACAAALCWYARDRSWLTGSGPTSSTMSPSRSAPPASARWKAKSSSRETTSTS